MTAGSVRVVPSSAATISATYSSSFGSPPDSVRR